MEVQLPGSCPAGLGWRPDWLADAVSEVVVGDDTIDTLVRNWIGIGGAGG